MYHRVLFYLNKVYCAMWSVDIDDHSFVWPKLLILLDAVMLWCQANFSRKAAFYPVIFTTYCVISWPRLASFSYTKPAPDPQSQARNSCPDFRQFFPAFSWIFQPFFGGFFLRFSRLFGQISQLYWPEPLRMIPDNPRDNSWSFRAFSGSSREIER